MPAITYPGQFLLSLGQRIEAEKIAPVKTEMKSFAHSQEYLQSIGHPSVYEQAEYLGSGNPLIPVSEWPFAAPQYPAKDDGWIEWKGGECPVKDWEAVEIKLDGDQKTNPPMVIKDHASNGCRIHWERKYPANSGLNIVAYRVVQP